MHARLPVLTFLATLFVAAAFAPALAQDTPSQQTMLVLDASGSMWGQIDGRSKVEIAREAVGEIVTNWNSEHHLGLIAYGHRRKGDCADIETLIPAGPLDRAAFMNVVNGLNAKGMTPLSQAVIDAAAALRSSEQKATVILVSDGEETCNLDPCAVGAELEASGVDFTAHVIGFDIQNPVHQAQLRCLAENTGGRYFNARNASELGSALQGAVSASTKAAPPPASATLTPRGDARIVQPLPVDWTGPGDDGDYISVSVTDSKPAEYLTYAYVKAADTAGQGSVSLAMPATAGTYELRYVSLSREQPVLARQTLVVADSEARIEAPETAYAGDEISVIAEGPVSSSHWIGFAPKGSTQNTYSSGHYKRPTGPRSELQLTVPAAPGEYELRYVLNENERIAATRPITVLPAKNRIEAPDSAEAGTTITVIAEGPVSSSHWIGFAPKGGAPGDYINGHYARPTGARSELQLAVPAEPGDYELRYVLYESESVAASRPITVIDPSATISGPAQVKAGSSVTIDASGPFATGHWIGFAPAGSGTSAYVSGSWGRLKGATSVPGVA